MPYAPSYGAAQWVIAPDRTRSRWKEDVVTDTAEYQPLDGLPVPVLVVRGTQVVHANPALLAMMGLGMEEVRATSVLMLMARFAPADPTWFEPLHVAAPRGPSTGQVWVRVLVGSTQERTFCLYRGSGQHPDDTLLVFVDAEGEASTRRLTESLVEAAGELMHCRDEQTVLETAVDSIHRQGFVVGVLLLDGDTLVQGPLRQAPAQVAAGELLYGQPVEETRWPRASMPHLEEVFSRRKAAFHHDFLQSLEHFHAAEPLAWMRRVHPPVRALDTPIFVEEQPYGILSVQGESLTPTSAATLALFARQVGGALENVRHHRLAAERLAELSRLQAELVKQARLTVLGEAAGVVAHEVRNPLGAILNAVAVLKRDKLGPLGASVVTILEEEATRLDVMVRDLLDVVRPLEPRSRPLHLGELARRTLELLRGRQQLGTMQVSVEAAEELPILHADEMLLQLALENLLRNAVQASPPDSRVTVCVARVSEGILLTVEDEGPGISPADIHRIFEPFFTTRATGTGLGLAVVQRVVLAHGGTVSVGQRRGGGARFELRLPLQVESRPLPPERPLPG